MSRSGYSDELDPTQLALYRGRVSSAIRGRRGQRFLVDLLRALDAMPARRLVTDALEEGGEVCAIGALGAARGVDMRDLNPEDPRLVGAAFDIASCLAAEVVYENDEAGEFRWRGRDETPEERWVRMRGWVAQQIRDGAVDNHPAP